MAPTDPDQAAATDAELARRWAAGEERGYEALVVRYAPMVHARCRRSLCIADADDATQAVFLVLHGRRAQASASPALAAWLLMVADNVVRNALRDRRRRATAEANAPIPTCAEEPRMDDVREHLDRCLAELPAAEREAVQLYHLAGHTLAEIAAHTRTPVQTIHARVQRGLLRLRELLVRRGVAITVAALMAGLHAEANAAPAAVIDRALSISLIPAGGVTSAHPAHLHRWSHQGWSFMTTASIAGVAALLVGTLTLHLLHGSESATTSVVPGQVPTDPPLVHRGPSRGPFVISVNEDSSTTMIALADMPLPPSASGALSTSVGRQAGTVAHIDGRTFLVGKTPDGKEVRIPISGADGLTLAAETPMVRGQVEFVDGQATATWTDSQGKPH